MRPQYFNTIFLGELNDSRFWIQRFWKNTIQLTTEISWEGKLTNENKIEDLNGFITRHGSMVDRFYFKEDHVNVFGKTVNSYYILKAKYLLTESDCPELV